MDKKNYTIVVKETLYHEFEVEATSPQDAIDVFNSRNNRGEFDYSDGNLIDSEVSVKPAEDDGVFKFERFCNTMCNIRGVVVYGNNIDDGAYVEIPIMIDEHINKAHKIIEEFGYKIIKEHECEGSDYPSYCIWFGEVEQ